MSYATLVPGDELNVVNFTSISDVGINTLRAHFVNSEFTLSYPSNDTQIEYRISNYCEQVSLNGNDNIDEVNIFRKKIYEKSLSLAWENFDILDTQNYQNIFSMKFGTNYINIFALSYGYPSVEVSLSITHNFFDKIPVSNYRNVAGRIFNQTFIKSLTHDEQIRLFIGSFFISDIEFLSFGFSYYSGDFSDYDKSYTPYEIGFFGPYAFNRNSFFEQLGRPEEIPDYPDSEPDGNEGIEDDPTEPTGEPDLPDIGISSIGLVNVYNVTTDELNGFADDLFPTFDLPEPTTNTGLDGVVDNLYNVADTIAKFGQSFINNGLINYVLDCHIVPCLPSIADKTNIKVGFKSFTQQANKVVSDYVEINCGTVNVVSVYKNFLDYVGVRIKLYLPFIGFVDVNPTWCMGGTLKVKYHFNIIDGSCVAFVIGSSPKANFNNTVVATYGGNCCVHIPITGVNYSSMISGIVGTVSRADSSTSGISSAVSDALNLVSSKPNLQSSNGYNSGMGFLSYRRPYILVERPVASISKKYPSEKGLPCNITYKLESLKGFTVCENVRITNNTGILQREEQLIIEQLRNGIIL